MDKAATHAVAESIRKDGGVATEAVADISDSAAVRGMFEKAVRKHGGIDVLVDNAFANFRDVTLVDLAEADWDRTLNVCLKGPFLCCQRNLSGHHRYGSWDAVSAAVSRQFCKAKRDVSHGPHWDP